MKTNARIRKVSKVSAKEDGCSNPIPHEGSLPRSKKMSYPSMAEAVEKISDPVGLEFLRAFYRINK